MADEDWDEMGATTAGIFAGVAAGDEAALGDLLTHYQSRLRVLARAELARYPRVAELCETDDVRQGVATRLIRAVRDVKPDTPARFWGLVYKHLRLELIDLKRKGYGPHGDGGRVYANRPADPEKHDAVLAGKPDPATGLLTQLAEDELQERVQQLPEPEREVVKLHAYCGLTHSEVADVLGLTREQARKLWYDALGTLGRSLKGFGPTASQPG